MLKTIAPSHTFTADGAGPWVPVGPFRDPAQFHQLLAKGDLGGGTLSLEGALITEASRPNEDGPVPDTHIVPIPSASIADLAADDPVLFSTRLAWVRPVLTGSGGVFSLNVWIV